MSDRLLENRLALVTGAASDIGRVIAVAYASASAHVILTDRSATDCEAALAEVRAVACARGVGVGGLRSCLATLRRVRHTAPHFRLQCPR